VRLTRDQRHAGSKRREDLVVEALETPLALPDDLRLEAALAIPRRRDPHRLSFLGLETTPTPTHAADALAVAICQALAPPLLQLTG
jgi:hypothetical protein